MSGSGSAASAIRRGNVSNSVSSIFPAFFPNEGNEANAGQVLLLDRAIVSLRHFDEFLNPSRTAKRHDDFSAWRELIEQRLGHVTPAGRGQDRVIGRTLRPALGPVALDNVDIVESEAPHAV